MKTTTLVIVFFGAAVIAAGIYGKYRLDRYEPSEYLGPELPKPAHIARVGDAIAPIELTDLDGKRVTLGGPRKRSVLVHYWASWCLPCIQELPAYESAKVSLDAQGIDVITIAQDDRDHAAEVAQRQHVTLPVWFSDGAATDPLLALGSGMGSVPFNVLLDPNGAVIAQKLGIIAGGTDGLLAWVNHSTQQRK